MLRKLLQHKNVILASGSPRRQQFFKDLDIDFEIRVKSVDEVYPPTLQGAEISDYLAVLKTKPFQGELEPNDLLITSDTIVWHQGKALGKPKDADEAFAMLRSMSGASHEVFTSVCFTTPDSQKTVHACTKVFFKSLSDDEIHYYINTCQPFDKAGAYGIQEWIGNVAVEKIEGSYVNVMGMPMHLVYKTLREFIS